MKNKSEQHLEKMKDGPKRTPLADKKLKPGTITKLYEKAIAHAKKKTEENLKGDSK